MTTLHSKEVQIDGRQWRLGNILLCFCKLYFGVEVVWANTANVVARALERDLRCNEIGEDPDLRTFGIERSGVIWLYLMKS